MNTILSEVNAKENIIIKGAKLHNLKNIDVVIPRNKLVVITGLSGSGKNSVHRFFKGIICKDNTSQRA